MGVASIPEHKDQQPRRRDQGSCDEWPALERLSEKMELGKSGPDEFVTVVSVGSQPNAENFVTVLSIGNSNKKEEDPNSSVATPKTQTNGCAEGYLEEEVEVYRLPGERLGFGLKFEGGNKTSERVRRLFVQSCAEQSPASRAKCSWGTLGEGDEVLSIDGVPVTHMTRLDCVRRLKESQLVIKLTVRCRGALRPEVVSAERKTPPERSKVPPELPSAPPPVPPRKLRQQSRGLADGEANPCPVTRSWDRSKAQNGTTPHGQANAPNKTAAYENCEPTKYHNNPAKDSTSERSPVLQKSKQEPPEAMVYLDARSQCGSTHGSTSDDTGSSMSTVVDRFSTSDRVSTISTVSTASITSEHQSNDCPTFTQECDDTENDLSRTVCPFDLLEREFQTSPPDYLLRRLANSEAVTHVESRGEVERITAVVAPNTVVIEETITLQPPLSFQDAPLSYGHEPRPDLFYAADLAADSTTHFRPIKDDAAVVERVNGDLQVDRQKEVQRFVESVSAKATVVNSDRKENGSVGESESGRTPPPLPARNHVNRISVNQQPDSATQSSQQPAVAKESSASPRPAVQDVTKPSTVDTSCRQEVPILPPKPLPRRDVRRKRLPPPPPPPITPRRETRTNPSAEKSQGDDDKGNDELRKTTDSKDSDKSPPSKNFSQQQNQNMRRSSSTESSSENSVFESPSRSKTSSFDSDSPSPQKKINEDRDDVDSDNKLYTNKVLEIIEIRKARALSPQKAIEQGENQSARGDNAENRENPARNEAARKSPETAASGSPGKRSLKCVDSVSTDCEGTETDDYSEDLKSDKQKAPTSEDDSASYKEAVEIKDETPADKEKRESDDDDDDDGTYKSLDEVKDDMKNSDVNGTSDEDDLESDSTDDSDDGRCCWQSHLATIGEEEETNSLEYINANNDTSESRTKNAVKPEPVTPPTREKDARHKNGSVNDRMDNCGGGQRLPPDGDEFPAAYQEFTNEQQYQYTTVGRSTAAMTSNDDHDCNEIEPYAANNDFISTKTVLVNVESISEERNVDSITENKTNPYKVTESLTKKNNASQNMGHYPAYQAGNSNVVVFEKKIETVRYYQKDNTPQFHKDLASETELINRLGNDAPSNDAPPPLPLTGPPKIEQVTTSHARNMPPVIGTQQQRKFSLNGELRRQDDKSEKSVRDKIAMFSSRDHLEAPLFPNNAVVSSNGRKLSKYRSSDDVCNDEKSTSQKEKISFLADKTRSSFDLTDSAKSVAQDYGRKGSNSPQSNQSSYPAPNVLQRPPLIPSSTVSDATNCPLNSPFETKRNLSPTSPTSYSSVISSYSFADQQNGDLVSKSPKSSGLTRATSFSGSTPFAQDRSPTSNESPAGLQVSRTNSLASTFRPKVNEDARRSSLNQLIEQRRKSISKLRGLVIPEKNAVSVDQPIVDLPEIKSRDSILLRQIPKTNIQDKWGSQSSLASNTSTTSAPVKTTSFKMPAPQIHSKYSPAFKRKSLAVYTSTSSSGNSKNGQNSASPTTTMQNSEPPKSLESICSPTRNDYSFEYASSSPETLRSRPKTLQKKTRAEYDDSDNDSAVSSSQSSISRGCSPPMSPVPSERSTVSSERSYVSTETNYQRGSLILDSPTRTYLARENIITEKERFSFRPNNLGYLSSEGSSSSSGSSHSRSPQPLETNPKNSQIPQRLTLKRSSSTETNCSTSSTLTSGSQASTESLSRRVLKPQSVEAINRKNILASARCRSGRDLNGSPLIQRKFPEDETASSAKSENSANAMVDARNNSGPPEQNIKIAYLEETDSFPEEDRIYEKTNEETKSPSKRSIPVPMNRFSKSDVIEPSNDLRMWVRSEAKTLMKSVEEKPVNTGGKTASSPQNDVLTKPQNRFTGQQERRNGPLDVSSEESDTAGMLTKKTSKADNSSCALDTTKPKPKPNMAVKKDPEPNDLLTVLTTRSRSRSTIHVDSNTFNRSKSQMDLDDLLGGKLDPVVLRTPRNDTKPERNGAVSETLKKIERIENHREKKLSSSESCDEEKTFVSKIPTFGKPRVNNSTSEKTTDALEKWRAASTRIPTTRALGRRSASVTDMKKALEKGDVNSVGTNSTGTQPQSVRSAHNRFPSLDSSMEENSSPISTETETDRYCGEQFGSITSLASSTSLISQQELAQLVEEASLEEPRGVHDVIVVPLHKENPSGSVGITLAGGVDCEIKEITVHRVLAHSIADKDGRIQRGDRILSINGRSTRGLTHRESLAVLKQPRSEIVLVVSRSRLEEDCKLKTRTDSVETIVEALEINGNAEHTAWGPPATVAIYKDGAGLGFSLEGGRDSPLGDRPLLIKKIFTGGAAEKTGLLKAGDQLLEVNGSDVTRMSRIEAWSLMKKLHDGEVNLLVRHPATKST